MTGIFNSVIFNNRVFNTGSPGVVTETPVKTGTGGIDIVKPTGLLRRKTLHLKKKSDERIEQQIEDQLEIATKLAREFEIPLSPPIREMSMVEVEREIAQLMGKKLRTSDDEILLLMLLAACNSL